MKANIEHPTRITHDRVREYTGNEDVMCLHALGQPLATELQNIVRFQYAQAKTAAAAIRYVLDHIKRNSVLRYEIGAGTQTFEELTAAYAGLTGDDVDQVRNDTIRGSAALHRHQEAA